MVKKEYEGKVGPLGAKKANEYTDKYEFIRDAIIATEEIHQGETCTPERIGKIEAGRVALNDISPSDTKEIIDIALYKAIKKCKDKGECRICDDLI